MLPVLLEFLCGTVTFTLTEQGFAKEKADVVLDGLPALVAEFGLV